MNTISESPRRKLERLLGLKPEQWTSRTGDATCPFRIGSKVSPKADPRHVGEVCATFSGKVKVLWESGIYEYIYFTKLQPAEDDTFDGAVARMSPLRRT